MRYLILEENNNDLGISLNLVRLGLYYNLDLAMEKLKIAKQNNPNRSFILVAVLVES